MTVKVTNRITRHDIKTATNIIYEITKEQALEMDFKMLDQLVLNLRELGGAAKGKIIISFRGYDDEPREVFTVPELKRYVRKVVEKYPYFCYFLDVKADQNFMAFILCVHEATVTGLNAEGRNDIRVASNREDCLNLVDGIFEYGCICGNAFEELKPILDLITMYSGIGKL